MTVFITSFHPLISRNIIGTSIVRFLAESGQRVILFVPSKKEKFFNEHFAREGVIIEPIDKKLSRRDFFLRYLAFSAINTCALKIKRKTEMKGSGEWIAPILSNKAAKSLSHLGIRRLSYWLTPKDKFGELFEKYKPEIVFSTDVQNENDARLLTEAKARGVKTVGMVRSWDNMTCKGLVRLIPDKLLVNNEIVKEEAARIQGISENKIEIVGIPHYDYYFSAKPSVREDFFKKIGGNPKKKLVLFAPIGDRYLINNTVDKDIVDILNKELPQDFQILVRLPLADRATGIEEGRFGRVIIERPIKNFKEIRNNEITRKDDEHLIDSVFWSDVVVSGPSTMCVDAALFDKPVILTAFDGYQTRPYYQSVRRYFDYNHWEPVKKSGGAYLAESKEDFVKKLKEYIAGPASDKKGRRRLIEGQAWKLDGRASERIAEAVLLK